jgi:thiamine-phosphate pyrophosphorylase
MSSIHKKRVKTLMEALLYVITDREMANDAAFTEIARQVFAGGARLLQLRAKMVPFDELLSAGKSLVALSREYDALLLVNDNPYLARDIGADGVHLGQEDVPIEVARDILGPDAIIGLSTHSYEQILRAQQKPIDYIAIGPIYPTTSKANAERPMGVEAVEWAARQSVHPVVAIGGINKSNIAEVARAGADSVAVISAVMSAPDLARASSELIDSIKSARAEAK